jgi:flagellar biosynthesis GTPase FlhF
VKLYIRWNFKPKIPVDSTSGSMPPSMKGPAVVVPVDIEPIPTSFQELHQLFLKEKENSAKEKENAAKEKENSAKEKENAAKEKENAAKEMKEMKNEVLKMKNEVHKVKISHSSDAKFLGAPHLLNIANEILHLFKGRMKPKPTKTTFVSFTGAKKKRFDALVKNLGVDGNEWAKKCDRINELCNAGIQCDTWQMVATRVNAALSFLKRRSYLRRSERDAVFIIDNYSKFKNHSSKS